MATKYRIRLNSGRIIGPFVVKQIGELYLKGHINGEEMGQEFPVGDWKPISQHKEIKSLITRIVNEDLAIDDLQSTKTHTIAKLSAAQKAKKEKKLEDEEPDLHKSDSSEDFKEFRFGTDDGPKVDYEELEKKYEKKKKELEKKSKRIEATRVIKRPPKSEKVEKTVIIKKDDLPAINDGEESESNETNTSEVEEVKQEEEKDENISSDEKTEFFNLDSAMASLKVEVKVSEGELEKREIEENRSLKVLDDEEDEVEDDEEDDEEEDKPKRKLKPITIMIALGLFTFLLMPDEKKEVVIEPIYLEVSFPVAKEFKDEVKSEREFERGEKDFQQNTYSGRLDAKEHYVKSLEHKVKDNPAMARLLYIYAYDYKNVKDEVRADKNIFRLVKLNDSKVLTDPGIALSTSLFYYQNGKSMTALRTIENYLRLSKPSEKIYALYVDILMKVGEYDQARKVLDNLEGIKSKSLESYLSIAHFYYVDQRFDRSLEVLDEGLKNYPQSVALLIKQGSVLLAKEDFKGLSNITKEIKKASAESSPYYYSKYLEFKGVLSAANGQQESATQLFTKALSYYESDELRSLLSQADLKGKDSSRMLILESKVIELMGRARQKFSERKWNMALSLAIEAADLMPNYIPAQLLLAKIQNNRGFFESALSNLERLRESFPVNANINYALVRTYLMSHRLEDAERELAILGNTEFSVTAQYAMALAQYYEKIDNLQLSIRFYRESIDRSPLNDDNYFRLAKIFLRYKRFERSKQMILEAISLDPTNVYYHSVYASILYETQTSDAAIGYLRGILEKNEEHPKILGDIAIYYYRLGKANEFEEYKKRIEDLNIRDQSFYEFLVESSRLRGKEKEVVDYSRELIKVNPGDLDVRMDLGRYLLKRGYYKDALDEFAEIVERLANYPRAHYYIAKCYIVQEDYKKAMEHAEKEIKGNPSLESGYYIKGEILRLEGNYQESAKLLEKAISIEGKSVEALLALGWIKMRQNYLDTARELYLRAMKEDRSVPDIHLQLGHIYRSSGQSQLAVESYETYLKLYPDAPNKQEIQNRIRQLR